MIEYLFVAYIIGVTACFGAVQGMAPKYKEETGEDVPIAIALIIAAAWPIALAYVAAKLVTDDDAAI